MDEDLPHSTNMRQRGIQIRSVEDLMNVKFDSLGIGPGADSGASPYGFDFEETSPSSPGSRRSSAATTSKKTLKKESLGPPAPTISSPHGRRGSVVDPKGLPIITEKSDTQSVATEEEQSLKE